MTNELAKTDPTPMQILADMAKTADPAKIEAMMQLQERWEDRVALRDYSEALAVFQAACPPIKKTRGVSFDKGNTTAYKYASLDDIMRAIQPHLQTAGLSISFSCETIDKALKTTCFVQHGIHKEPYTVTLPVPSSMNVNETQKAGAALSYGKRYALMAALNIVVEDEDTDARGMDMKPVKLITEKQAITITEGFAAVEADVPKFLGHYSIKTIADLPSHKFEDVMKLIKQREQQRENK